jgi:hypothetical protein
MSNLKLDGRTIAIIALVVIAAIIFLPSLLGKNQGGTTDVQPTANPRDTTVVDDGIELGTVVTASNVDRNGCPTDTTTTFPTGSDVVYVVAENSDFVAGTEVYVRWYREGQVLEDAEPIVADQDYVDTCVNFLLEPDQATTLASGDYEAEFIINGNPADTATFEIR